MKDRVGRLEISSVFIEDALGDPAAYPVRAIFEEFIPTRCEHIYHARKFEYCGYSRQFDALAPGEAIPLYKAEITLDESGGCSVKFKRVNNG